MEKVGNVIKKHLRSRSQETVQHVERAGSSVVGIDVAEEANIIELSIWETVRHHPMIIVCCVYANVGALMYGFDNISLSLCLTMNPFIQTFGENVDGVFIIPAYWQSLWNALAQLATGIGAAGAGPLADRFAILYTSSTQGQFLAGKIVNAFGLGMALTTGQIYVSEVTPLKIRGAALSTYGFCTNLGYLIAASVAFKRVNITTDASYRVLFAAEWIWPALLLLGFLLISESPFYLVRKGKLESANKSLLRLIREESFIDNSEATYVDCFKGTNARRTRIILYANAIPQMIGTTFIANAPYFMITAGLSPSNSTMMVELGIGFAIISSALTFYFMTFIGRRKMILAGIGSAMLLYLIMGIISSLPTTSATLWGIGVLLQMVWWTVGPAIGPAISVAGEVSSIRLRAKSQSLGFLFNYCYSTIWNVVVPYMFNTNEGNLGGKMGWIFFGTCVISGIVVFLEVPETKDRGFDELDEMFEEKIGVRRFKEYVTSRHRGGVEKGDVVEE